MRRGWLAYLDYRERLVLELRAYDRNANVLCFPVAGRGDKTWKAIGKAVNVGPEKASAIANRARNKVREMESVEHACLTSRNRLIAWENDQG